MENVSVSPDGFGIRIFTGISIGVEVPPVVSLNAVVGLADVLAFN